MKFEVTVSRTGLVIVDDPAITTAAQAMAEVNAHATDDDVNWSDDWPATDAQEACD